jgi:hypothetical protein
MSTLYNPVPTTIYDDDGHIAVGATAEFFLAGTSTPLTVYADADQTTPLAPVTNGAGRFPPIYIPTVNYKVRIKTASGAILFEADDALSDAAGPEGGPGIVSIGDRLTLDEAGTLDVPIATASVLGVVKAGSGLSVDGAGALSVSAPAVISDTTPVAMNTFLSTQLNTLTHTLGSKKQLVQLLAVCTAADANYAIGDTITPTLSADDGSDEIPFAPAISYNSTNIYARCVTSGGWTIRASAPNKTSGAFSTLTQSKWNVVLRSIGV